MRTASPLPRVARIVRPSLAAVALAVAGLCVAFVPQVVLADDPPAVTADESAQIARLIEELGSADFRVREAATAALIAFGEKARPALEKAAKSENPAVRFRADQLLLGLGGTKGEQRFDDGTAGGKPDGSPSDPREAMERAMRELREKWNAGLFDEQRKEFERRLRELQEHAERGFGPGGNFGPGSGFELPDWARRHMDFGPQAGRRGIDVTTETDAHRLSLVERRQQVRIEIRAKRDGDHVAVFTGKTVDGLLLAYPLLRDWPGVADLLTKHEAAKKERETTSRAAPAVTNRSVSIESGPGRVKVTISETGQDGKPVTKTYEGPDLETLRQRHPELREALGGFTIHLGPVPHGFEPFVPGVPPQPGASPSFGDDHTPPETGPFGLALTEVDPVLRRHVGLGVGEGAVVVAVRDGSDAAKLGLRENDVVVRVNDTVVKALGDVGTAIRAVPEGGALSIHVLRDGKPVTLAR